MLVAPPSVPVGMGADLTRPDPGLCVYGPCGPSIISVLCLPDDAVPTRGSSGLQVQPWASYLAADRGRRTEASGRQKTPCCSSGIWTHADVN